MAVSAAGSAAGAGSAAAGVPGAAGAGSDSIAGAAAPAAGSPAGDESAGAGVSGVAGAGSDSTAGAAAPAAGSATGDESASAGVSGAAGAGSDSIAGTAAPAAGSAAAPRDVPVSQPAVRLRAPAPQLQLRPTPRRLVPALELPPVGPWAACSRRSGPFSRCLRRGGVLAFRRCLGRHRPHARQFRLGGFHREWQNGLRRQHGGLFARRRFRRLLGIGRRFLDRRSGRRLLLGRRRSSRRLLYRRFLYRRFFDGRDHRFPRLLRGPGRSGRQNHLRQDTLNEFRHFRAAPPARALAAESAIGQQAERSFDRIEPARARRLIGERNHRPQARACPEFDASGGVALGRPAQPVDRRVRPHAGTERTRPAGRHQAFTSRIHAPLALIQAVPGQNGLHHPQWHKAGAFPSHPGGKQGRRGRRPDRPRRHHEPDLLQKRKAGAKAHRRDAVVHGGFQPLLQRPQPAQRRGHRRVEGSLW